MSMIRIIHGVVLESYQTDEFRLKAHHLGNGHVELSAHRIIGWQELDWSERKIRTYLENKEKWPDHTEEELRAKHALQAAKRAKKRVRQLCKSMGADTILTLTYKFNEGDMQKCKTDLKEFNRRMLRIIPGFRFVAAFERQERGACHVHMATERLPAQLPARNGVKVKSFNVIRAVWRSVTKEREGNIDVSATKRRSQRSPARIAAYIAGYIIKAFEEGEAESNRWTKYGKFDLPPRPVDLGVYPNHTSAIFAAYAYLSEDLVVDLARFDRWKDWFVLYAELPSKGRSTYAN